jgi:hypothetical protein
MPNRRPTNGDIQQMVQDIDEYIKDNEVTDWELNFIADMMDRIRTQRGMTFSHQNSVITIFEKYDV